MLWHNFIAGQANEAAQRAEVENEVAETYRAQIRDLQQALRTERDTRKAAEEALDQAFGRLRGYDQIGNHAIKHARNLAIRLSAMQQKLTAAEEARDGYRIKAERAEAHVEVLSQAIQLQVPLTRPERAADGEAEISRLRHLVECAYGEGIADVFTRGARISEDNDTWERADTFAALDDIEFHRLMWPEHFEGDEG